MAGQGCLPWAVVPDCGLSKRIERGGWGRGRLAGVRAAQLAAKETHKLRGGWGAPGFRHVDCGFMRHSAWEWGANEIGSRMR